MTIALAIWKFLRGVPWQVYAAIGAALLTWQAIAWHGRAVEARLSVAYAQGVKDTTATFVAAQAKADDAQRAKIAATADKIDTSNREITNEHLASRDDIGARADALRVRAKAIEGQRAASTGNLPGISDAPGGADATACHGGLSLQDQITSLEQAELNTRQLIDLQRSIVSAAAIWNQKDNPDDRARSETAGESDLLPAGAAVLPNITYATSVNASVSTQTQTATGIAVPGSSNELAVLIGVTVATVGVDFSSLTVTAQPSNTPIVATLEEKHAPTGQPILAAYKAVVPAGTTSIDLSQVFSANPFARCRWHIGTIPVANMNATTKVGSGKTRTAASTSSTVNLPTSAGGVVFAIGCSLVGSGGASGTFSGTESYTTRSTLIANGGAHAVGDCSGTADNASSSVTLTYSNAADITVLAVSYR